MHPKQEAEMLFWGSVLAPALYKQLDDERSDRQILLDLSRQTFTFIDGHPRTFSYSTLKRKLRSYRLKGAEGLLPAIRCDEGHIRGNRKETLQRAIDLKREQPARSHNSINLILQSEGHEPIPTSTLLRHLRAHGATLRKLGYESKIVRKRWSRDHTHSLWVGDFSQGPMIIDEHGQAQKTWNSAFIDAHSRFLVTGVYAMTCDIHALVSSLLAAFSTHGTPTSIYVDNAKVYRGGVLSRACLDLGIDLIHRTAYDPQGGGLIERFFLTAQTQFERELPTCKAPLSLDKLNELFRRWVEYVYHQTKHRDTQLKPVDHYRSGLKVPVSPLRSEVARASFYQQWTRVVHPDFCDVSLNGQLYRCDTRLRCDKVLLRCPLGTIPETLKVYDLMGRKEIGIATRHDRSKREVPLPQPLPASTTDFEQTLKKIEKLHEDKEERMRTPSPLPEETKWPLQTFVSQLCEVCGISMESLNDSDLDVLLKVHAHLKRLNKRVLMETWRYCEPKTFQQLVIQLAQGGPS